MLDIEMIDSFQGNETQCYHLVYEVGDPSFQYPCLWETLLKNKTPWNISRKQLLLQEPQTFARMCRQVALDIIKIRQIEGGGGHQLYRKTRIIFQKPLALKIYIRVDEEKKEPSR